MADVKISALPVASTLAATDVLPMVQPSGTVKVAMSVLDSRWLSSATGGTVNGSVTVVGGVTVSSFIAVGTNPAQSSALRMANTAAISFRDSTNGFDLRTLSRDATNRIQLGFNDPGGSGLDLRGRPDIGFYSGSTKIGAMGLTHFAMGTNPAASGIVRIPNDQPITARNAANSADVPMLKVGTAGTVQYWNGTAWADVGSGGGGVARELGYGQLTSNLAIGAGNEASANTIAATGSIVLDGSAILVEVVIPAVSLPAGVGSVFNVFLFEDAVSLGNVSQTMSVVAGQGTVSLHGARRLSAPTGTRTYSARAACSAGTGTVIAGPGGAGAAVPAFIRVSRAS